MAAANADSVLTVAHAAVQYVASGWALVPIPAGTKGPTSKGWNTRENCITSAEDARRLRGNIGLAHAYSGTCALDIDRLDEARAWFTLNGLDIDRYLAAPDRVGIKSGRPNRAKLLFRLPTPRVSASVRVGKVEVVQFRCASATGRTLQDVLPPSVHPETRDAYEWDYDDLVTDWREPPPMPAELLALWDIAAEGDTLPASTEPRDPVDNIRTPTGVSLAAARTLLATLDPDADYLEWLRHGMALHHEFGDEGFELWDEWSRTDNYGGHELLERKWESFGRSGGTPITLRYTIKKAAEKGVTVPKAEPAPLPAGRFAFERAHLFAERAPPDWLVRNLIPERGLVMVFGASGSGKTFAVLDILGAAARGEPWRQRDTRKCRIAYVCAEGAGGFRSRLKAWAIGAGVNLADVHIIVLGDAPNFRDAAHAKAVIEGIETAGGADIVAVDTLAQVSPGANENSSEDMGPVVANCQAVIARTGAAVVLVHHSGKDASRGARGWSGIRGALDAEIEITREGQTREIRITKLKDGSDDEAPMPFMLVPVEVGHDADGVVVTSCKVKHDDPRPRPVKARQPSGDKQKIVLRVLTDLVGASVVGSVLVEDVVEASAPAIPRESTKEDRRKRDARRALLGLAAANFCQISGDEVTL